MTHPDSPWAKDKRLRQALYYLMPYDIILGALGVDCCRSGPLPLHQKPWALAESELPAYGLDLPTQIGEAVKMLDAAGYPAGTEIPLDFSISNFYGGKELGEALVGIFGALKDQTGGAVNINATLKVLDLADWFSTVYYGGGQYMGATHGDWNFDDPDNTFYRYFHSKGVANNTHFSSPELDALLEKQRGELNTEARIEQIKDVQKLLLEEVPVAYLLGPNTVTAKQPWLQNYTPMYLNNIELPRHFDEWWYSADAPQRT